jgi:hypothetical protein
MPSPVVPFPKNEAGEPIAWYAASALMLESAYKRPILGLAKTHRASAAPNLMPGTGEPGAIRGQ